MTFGICLVAYFVIGLIVGRQVAVTINREGQRIYPGAPDPAELAMLGIIWLLASMIWPIILAALVCAVVLRSTFGTVSPTKSHDTGPR